MAMVPSMVAINCIPAIAITAVKNRRVGIHVVDLVGVDAAVFSGCVSGM